MRANDILLNIFICRGFAVAATPIQTLFCSQSCTNGIMEFVIVTKVYGFAVVGDVTFPFIGPIYLDNTIHARFIVLTISGITQVAFIRDFSQILDAVISADPVDVVYQVFWYVSLVPQPNNPMVII